MFGTAFAYVIHVIRILYTEYEDLCNCSVCCMLETVRCGFYIRGTKIFAFCKRMHPKRIKILWGINMENFAFENVCAALRIWVDYE